MQQDASGSALLSAPLLDPRGLLALVAVAEHGSGAAAAAALAWSSPTVDHHLRRLETTLGATLLERSPRGSRLTSVGEEVLGQARRILAMNAETLERVRTLQQHGARLVRIGAFPTVGTELLPALHRHFADSDIELAVTLDETDALMHQFDDGHLDFAIVYTGGLERASWHAQASTVLSLVAEPMRLITAADHPLAHAHEVSLAEFASSRWALSASHADPVDAVFVQRCREAGFEPVVGMRSDDYSAVIELVAAGLFVGPVPEWVARRAGDRVALIDLAGAPVQREVLLLGRREDAVGRAVASAVAAIAASRRPTEPGRSRDCPADEYQETQKART